jgi:hypothetical protein
VLLYCSIISIIHVDTFNPIIRNFESFVQSISGGWEKGSIFTSISLVIDTELPLLVIDVGRDVVSTKQILTRLNSSVLAATGIALCSFLLQVMLISFIESLKTVADGLDAKFMESQFSRQLPGHLPNVFAYILLCLFGAYLLARDMSRLYNYIF